MLPRWVKKIYNLNISPEKHFAKSLKHTLGFAPICLDFYKRAFLHKSIITKEDFDKSIYNNERLEYLGDAILSSVVAEYLFKKYPFRDEGFLTKMRSKMVNRKVLNEVAGNIGIDAFLRQIGVTHVSDMMMGNAFEAFIGAIYLDAGYDRTKKYVIQRVIKPHLKVDQLENLNTNYKSQLLEHCQRNQQVVVFVVISQFRQQHRDRFKIGATVDNVEIATGEDFNKKNAEQLAARNALLKLGIITKEDIDI